MHSFVKSGIFYCFFMYLLTLKAHNSSPTNNIEKNEKTVSRYFVKLSKELLLEEIALVVQKKF